MWKYKIRYRSPAQSQEYRETIKLPDPVNDHRIVAPSFASQPRNQLTRVAIFSSYWSQRVNRQRKLQHRAITGRIERNDLDRMASLPVDARDLLDPLDRAALFWIYRTDGAKNSHRAESSSGSSASASPTLFK